MTRSAYPNLITRLLTLALVPLLALAQQPQAPPTFHAESSLVLVPVRVTAPNGDSVFNLAPSDFHLLDNGKPVPITVDADADTQPLSIVLVIQNSAEAAAALNKLKNRDHVFELLTQYPDTQLAIVTAGGVNVALALPFTADDDEINAAVDQLRLDSSHQDKPHSGGRILDAVDLATRMLSNVPRPRRRVIVLLSETRDHGSMNPLDQVLQRTETANIAVYGVYFSAFLLPFTEPQSKLPPPDHVGLDPGVILGELLHQMKKNVPATLARSTGGATFSFASNRGIEHAFEALARDLSAQYLLTFVPANQDAGLHQLQLTTTNPNLQLRYRRTYWSTLRAGSPTTSR